MSRSPKNSNVRERLLHVGLTTFARRGYHGTGIKEIVDTAEVPKGSFYNYFKSKEDFGIEIVRSHSAEFWKIWYECFDQSCADPIEALKNCFQKMLEQHEDCAVRALSIAGMLAAEMCENSEICRMTVNEVINEWQNNLACQIRKAQHFGSARTDISAEVLATLFWDAWQGGLVRSKAENSIEPVKQCCCLMLDKFIRI